jgi:hypothetical protein
MPVTPVDQGGRGWHVAAALVITLLGVLYALVAQNMTGVVDTTRDLYWAWQIGNGLAFPQVGPVIHSGVLQLGPWWYYLLAVPIALGAGIASVPVTISFIAWLQYPLGWLLGTRIGGPRLGFMLVLALVMPGWSALALMFATHTSVAGTALIALALAALAWDRDPRAWRALLVGLAAAAALHAHPSTLLVCVVVAVALLARRRLPLFRAFTHAGLALLVVVAAFLPVLLQGADALGAIAGNLAGHAERELATDLFSRLVPSVLGIAIGGGWSGPLLLSRWDMSTVQLVHFLWLIAVSAGFAGAFWPGASDSARRWALFAAILFVAQVAFLVVLRPILPMWMVNTALPMLALCLALGWSRIAGADLRGLMLGLLAAGFHAALGLALYGITLRAPTSFRMAEGGQPWLDASKRPRAWREEPAVALSLRELAALSPALCNADSVHGPLAFFVEQAHGLSVDAACGPRPQLRYGGTGAAVAAFGMPLAGWRAAGLEPETRGNSFGLTTRVRPLGPGAGDVRRALGPGDVAPHAEGEVGDHAWPLTLAAGELLAVSNLHPWSAPSRIDAVLADGRPAIRVHADPVLSLYRCDGCGGDAVTWDVRGNFAAGNYDLVALAAPLAGSPVRDRN